MIGVNGVGKSTIIPLLRNRLNLETVELHDFDERGVPDNADSFWRGSETLHWASVGKGNLAKGISTIICGYSKPKEIKAAEESLGIDISVYLLDANKEVIEKRILNRYTTPESLEELERTTGKTPEKFTQDNVWVSTKFKDEAIQNGYFVLDTSSLSPEETADSLINLFE